MEIQSAGASARVNEGADVASWFTHQVNHPGSFKALLLATLCLLSLNLRADNIAVNFVGGSDTNGTPQGLGPEEVAGYVPQRFWNNAAGSSGSMNLTGDAGGSSPASYTFFNVTWETAHGTGSTAITEGTGDSRLMKGHLVAQKLEQPFTRIRVDWVPSKFVSSRYAVVVYFDGENPSADRVTSVLFNGVSAGTQFRYGLDKAGVDFMGKYTRVPDGSTFNRGSDTPAGNIMVFSPIKDWSFEVIVSGGTASDGNQRGAINALQIVPLDSLPTPLLITSAIQHSGTAGLPFQYAITTVGKPTSFETTPLPEGLTLDPTTGVVSGRPNRAGYYELTLTARNATEVATLDVSFVILPAPIQLMGELKFPQVIVGSTATTNFTIYGHPEQVANVTGITYPPGFTGPNWTGTIPINGSQVIPVTFAPTAGGSFAGDVAVSFTSPTGFLTIPATGTALAPDTTPPSVVIDIPTTEPTYTTTSPNFLISGTATDDRALDRILWANDRGGSGQAIGRSPWVIENALIQPGTNVVTVTAKDTAGNMGSATLTVVYTAPPMPNLKAHIPNDWPDSIVISTSASNRVQRSVTFNDRDLFVDWAVINDSTVGTTPRFYTRLLVDRTERARWYTDALPGGYYIYLSDVKIGKLSVGKHTIEIETDATGVISENNESDNRFSKTITVLNISRWNNDFVWRDMLETFPENTVGNNEGATAEVGEPDHGGVEGGRSVWWTWYSTVSGPVIIDTHGSSFDTVLAVYTGSALTNLTLVGANDDGNWDGTSRFGFHAVKDTYYQIAVDGFSGESGDIALAITAPTATNDFFADRVSLQGTPVVASGNNAGASREPGEPYHIDEDDTGGPSVWWTWTAPVSGQFAISTAGSDFDTVLAVYTGTTIESLTLVASNDEAELGEDSTSRVVINAVQGTTYAIAVDGYDGAQGEIVLTIKEVKLSSPKLTITAPGGLSIEGPVGQKHRLEFIDALGGTNQWQTFTRVTLTNSPQLQIDADWTNAPQRFYRAVAEP